MASSQRPAQFAYYRRTTGAEPAFPMSGHTFEVMAQEVNAWWKQNKPPPEKMCDPHMAMGAAQRQQFMANQPQPQSAPNVPNEPLSPKHQ